MGCPGTFPCVSGQLRLQSALKGKVPLTCGTRKSSGRFGFHGALYRKCNDLKEVLYRLEGIFF